MGERIRSLRGSDKTSVSEAPTISHPASLLAHREKITAINRELGCLSNKRIHGFGRGIGVDKPRSWLSNPLLLGPFIGWAAGILWWSGLSIAFAIKDGVLHSTNYSSLKVLKFAPFLAVPWAFMGLLVGIANLNLPGYWVPGVSLLGTLCGGVYALVTEPFDGWLVITMSIACVVGTFLGLGLGMTTRATWGYLHKWEDSL